MSVNPYGIPEAKLEFTGHDSMSAKDCWRIGKNVLYVPRGGDLPDRCVKCNGPALHPTKLRKFYWHSSAIYLFILLNLIIYAIVASIVRKKVSMSPGLCEQHARRRSQALYGSLGGFALMLVAAFMTLGQGWIGTALLCFLAALASGIAGSYLTRIVYPIGIDERGARFKGCGVAFLDSLEADRPY
jgi:hypothetical protein